MTYSLASQRDSSLFVLARCYREPLRPDTRTNVQLHPVPQRCCRSRSDRLLVAASLLARFTRYRDANLRPTTCHTAHFIAL